MTDSVQAQAALKSQPNLEVFDKSDKPTSSKEETPVVFKPYCVTTAKSSAIKKTTRPTRQQQKSGDHQAKTLKSQVMRSYNESVLLSEMKLKATAKRPG